MSRIKPISRSAIWRGAQADAQSMTPYGDPRRLLGGVLGLADAGVIAAAAFIAYVWRYGLTSIPQDAASPVALAALLLINLLYLADAYKAKVIDPLPQQMVQAFKAWTAVFAILLLVSFITRTSDSYSRTWATAWYCGSLAGLLAVRCLIVVRVRRLRRRGRLVDNVAILDLCNGGPAIGRQIRRLYSDRVHLVGVFPTGLTTDGIDAVDELLGISQLFRIDDVMVVTSLTTTVDVAAILRRLGSMPANVWCCPLIPELIQTPIRTASMLLAQPAFGIHRKPLEGLTVMAKRIEDIVVAGIAVLLLSPIMAIIALAVRVETPGPVLFRQERRGFNGNVFTILKFRTMRHQRVRDADVVQATRDDDRVTRVGRILRRTSADELPQLLNVLRGDMSLVGPRPHAIAHDYYYERLIDDYLARHKMQPGITGWAQVNGLRGETETLDKMQRRVQYDLAYIDQWSIMFDMKILFLTAFRVLFDRSAY